MSRIAKNPVILPAGVKIDINGQHVTVSSGKGTLQRDIHPDVAVIQADDKLELRVRTESRNAWALAGTSRALINNMVIGITRGFEKKLTIIGVGYRAEVKGRVLHLTLGFSHPVEFAIEDGIDIETTSPTEIVVKGVDKQRVCQVAANIRAYRKPEPYKGKGIRYADEEVRRKEAKKIR